MRKNPFSWILLFTVLVCSARWTYSKKGKHVFKKHVYKRQQVQQQATGGNQPLQASPLAATARKDDSLTNHQQCAEAMDLLLVFDASHSISPIGFALMKNRALDLVNKLRISPEGTHVSVLKYSTTISTFFMFEETALIDKTRRQINDLKFDNGWSRLDLALQGVADHVFNPAAGARTGVPKVAVVFTDGKVVGPREPDRIVDWRKLLSKPVEDLRKQNVILYSVSLLESPDHNDYANLDLVAGDRARVFTLTNLEKLSESLSRTAKTVCPGASTASPATPSLTVTPPLSVTSSGSFQATASASATAVSPSICPSLTSSCKPTSTCFPAGVKPCIHVYLVKVCNTFINTQCKGTPTTPTPTTRVKPTSTPPATTPRPPIPGPPPSPCPIPQGPVPQGPTQNVSPPRPDPCTGPTGPVIEPPVEPPCPPPGCPPPGPGPSPGSILAAEAQVQGKAQANAQANAQAQAGRLLAESAVSPAAGPGQVPAQPQPGPTSPCPDTNVTPTEPCPPTVPQSPALLPAPSPETAPAPAPAPAPSPAESASPSEYPYPAQVFYQVPAPTPSPAPSPAEAAISPPAQVPSPAPYPYDAATAASPVPAPAPAQLPIQA